eukprot:COSAG03_NODE_172_length_11193_cov_116.842527_4_plen_733_part_01
MRWLCGHMVALLIAIAMWMTAVTTNMTMQFNNDESVAVLRQYDGTGWSKGGGDAPGRMTMAVCNINGTKSNVFKVRKLGRILQGDGHDRNLPAVSLLGIMETATKSGDAAAAPFYDDLENDGTHKSSPDAEELQALTDNVCTDGRLWATKHVAVVASPEMNSTEIRVETSCDGRELTAHYMIGEVHYATVFVYMHGGKDKYRRMQVKRLHRALSRIPNGTRVALGGDWNFVLSVDRDIANPSHEYGKNDNIGQTECRDMMAGPAIKLTEVYEQLDIPVNHPGDLTWARGGKFSIGVVKRLDFWLMNADMIAAIDGEPRDAVQCVPVWFSLPDETTGEDVVRDDGTNKPGTDHSTVSVTFATGLPEVRKEPTRRVDRNTLACSTRLDDTQRGLQNQTRVILQTEVNQLEGDTDELRSQDQEPAGHTACDRAVKLFWAAYEEHAKRVKKESRCPELKAAQKQLQELRELQPDADCWDTVSQEWDRATRRLRNSLEDSARGASRWDDATRLNNGDNEVIGRLLSQRQDSANFTSMLVYDAQKDDVMSAELISDPDLRQRLEDLDSWRDPAIEPVIKQIGVPGTEVTDLHEMLANVSNMYGHLFRMRKTNLLAQQMMLDSFPQADALPAEVVRRMGLPASLAETRQAIEQIKSRKAADDEGMIAEVMQQFSPELWAILITESFNDSFSKGKLSPLERFGILKILYKKGDHRVLTNYRPLAITSIIYKIKATIIQMRW